MNKNIHTIILARCGSKGIPHKNIINLNQKPLLQYTIEAAKKSKANNSIWISTDCSQIMNIALKNNVNIISRSSNIAGDTNKSEDALLDFAKKILCDIIVFIQPTSPLLLPEDIDAGLEMMYKYDSIFSAYKEHWIPRWSIDGKPDNWDINNRPRRQEVLEKYVENGALYITQRDLLLNSKCRYSGKIGILEMPLCRSFQVDTYEDLELIKKLL